MSGGGHGPVTTGLPGNAKPMAQKQHLRAPSAVSRKSCRAAKHGDGPMYRHACNGDQATIIPDGETLDLTISMFGLDELGNGALNPIGSEEHGHELIQPALGHRLDLEHVAGR